jgi:hypothetical protein
MRRTLQCITVLVGASVVALGAASTVGATDDVFHEASTRSFDMGETFTYRGQVIAPMVAAEKRLSCNQERSGTTCFDSQEQALAAASGSPGEPSGTAQASRKEKRQGARAALTCSANDGRPLVLWEHTGEGGWNVNLFTRQWWANLDYPYFRNASAYRMGGHSGHMAEAADGYGFWYPGATGICAHDDMTGYSPSWNDRVSSRYRN